MNDRDGAKQRAHAALNRHRSVEKLSSLLHWDKEWTPFGILHRARQKKNSRRALTAIQIYFTEDFYNDEKIDKKKKQG